MYKKNNRVCSFCFNQGEAMTNGKGDVYIFTGGRYISSKKNYTINNNNNKNDRSVRVCTRNCVIDNRE